jgi:hypothetical protein
MEQNNFIHKRLSLGWHRQVQVHTAFPPTRTQVYTHTHTRTHK